MKATIEKLENNVVKMDITIPSDIAEKEYNKSCKRFKKFNLCRRYFLNVQTRYQIHKIKGSTNKS